MNRTCRLALVCFVVSLLICSVGYRFLSASPGPFVEDDSYFYAQIAYNIGTAHRSTFDGLHTTDGYHLLWGGILGAASELLAMFTRNKDAHLIAFLSVYLGLILFTAIRFGRSTAERCLLVAVGIWSAWLMESALVTLLLLVRVESMTERRPIGGRDMLAMLLLPLARIDATLIGAIWLLEPLIGRRFSSAARLGACLAAGVALHFAIMWTCFGHLASVSSEIKADHIADFATHLRHNLGGENLRRGLVLAIFAAAALIAAASAPERRRRLVIAAAGPVAFIAIHYVANNDVKSWYGSPVLACCVSVMFRARVPHLRRPLYVLTTLVCLYVGTSRVAAVLSTWKIAKASRAFVMGLARIVPPGAVVFHTDGAGYVGYHSGRRVINSDGLVNSHEYVARLRSGRLRNYLYENGVRFVVVNTPPAPLCPVLRYYGGMELRDPSPMLLLASSAIWLPGNSVWNFQLYAIAEQ